ncbi:DUF3710 domain-containing protein [Nocardioides dilutus]
MSEETADDFDVDLADGGTTSGAEPTTGPFDADELPDDGPERVDLGSLLIAPEPGRELRLQVDEASGAVQSVVLAGADGALELRAFAAPRNGDLWSEARPQIASEVAGRGGTATEREGRWGPELVCRVQVRTPDGKTGTQESRIIGINGPRWLLRGTLLGKPATDVEGSQDWEDLLSRVVVRRGAQAMPVGEPLAVTMPPQARRVEQ